MITEALPLTPEELTAEWLGGALGHPVSAVSVHEIIWGTATKVLLRVTYADDPGPGGPPAALCAKGGFQEELRSYGIAQAYATEARFYAELAPRLDIRLPRSWYAAVDPEHDQGVILLDDLAAEGATFGEPREPWTADLVAAGLEQQALWHARTWGSAPDGWLEVGAAPVRAAKDAFFSTEHWEGHRELKGAPRIPESLQDRARLSAGFDRLWELDDAGEHCVVHGDPHIGNTYIDREGRPGFIDWQAPCLAPYSDDVGYFITGALEPEVRREHERDLLRNYLDALAAAGGPSVGFDEAWLDYRRHALHGFLWALTPPVMQPIERVAAMGERHCAAIEDLETLDALGV